MGLSTDEVVEAIYRRLEFHQIAVSTWHAMATTD